MQPAPAYTPEPEARSPTFEDADIVTYFGETPCGVRVTGYWPAENGQRGHPDNWTPDLDEEFEYEFIDDDGHAITWPEDLADDDDHRDIVDALSRARRTFSG